MVKFEVGDRVSYVRDDFSILIGRVDRTDGCRDYPIIVEFPSEDFKVAFTVMGRRHESNTQRVLFHGHNVTVKVEEEEEPVRYKWINVYTDDDFVGRCYETEQRALNNISSIRKYITTIELKPEGE